jgi:hypothetical protein
MAGAVNGPRTHNGRSRDASIGLVRSASIFCIATVAASLGAADSRGAPTETAAAREQARLCERLPGASGAAACRQALALGIAPPRRAAVREQLAVTSSRSRTGTRSPSSSARA